MTRITKILLAATASALPALATPAAAQSTNCYEGIGCVSSERFKLKHVRELGCQPLREVRNEVFHARGYCFKSAGAIAQHGNAGCKFTDEAAVPLNAYERQNVRLIRKVEAEKGC